MADIAEIEVEELATGDSSMFKKKFLDFYKEKFSIYTKSEMETNRAMINRYMEDENRKFTVKAQLWAEKSVRELVNEDVNRAALANMAPELRLRQNFEIKVLKVSQIIPGNLSEGVDAIISIDGIPVNLKPKQLRRGLYEISNRGIPRNFIENFNNSSANLKKVGVNIYIGNGRKLMSVRLIPPLLKKFEKTPPSTSWVTLNTSINGPDQHELSYVPYFGDDRSEIPAVLAAYDIEKRQKIIQYGPIWQYEEMQKRKKKMNHYLDRYYPDESEAISDTDDKEKEQQGFKPVVHEDIAVLDRIIKPFSKFCVGEDTFGMQPDRNGECEPKLSQISNGDFEMKMDICDSNFYRIRSDTTYMKKMDSFKVLFCRQCNQYGCELHPLESPVSFPTQTINALIKSDTTYSKKPQESGAIIDLVSSDTDSNCGTEIMNHFRGSCDLLKSEAFLNRFCLIFSMDFNKIAKVLNMDPEEVKELAAKYRSEDYVLGYHEESQAQKQIYEKNGKGRKKGSYRVPHRQEHLKEKEFGEPINPFEACNHEGECKKNDQCTCYTLGHACEKYCKCSINCEFRFPGCNCNADCRAKACPCVAYGRECDPDICRSCGCDIEIVDGDTTKIIAPKCRNVPFTYGKHKRLFLGVSLIPDAGWGIFSYSSIKKGEFICEYVGERISKDELERRGHVYDAKDRSFIFELDFESALDSYRFGNKSKFINHSSTHANCVCQGKLSHGDQRLGLFALRDIAKGEELLFDYGKRFRGKFNEDDEKPAKQSIGGAVTRSRGSKSSRNDKRKRRKN